MKLLERAMVTSIHGMVNLDEMQRSFIPGKGTTDAHFIVRQMQEEYLAKSKDHWIALKDLVKSFE